MAKVEHQMIPAESLVVGDVIVRRKNDGSETRRRVVGIEVGYGTANGNGFGKSIAVTHVDADGPDETPRTVRVGYWWEVRVERFVEADADAPTASEFARSICQPTDHQPKTPRTRSAKPGTHVQRAIAAYRNRAVLTVDAFMKSLGADGDTIRRYRSSLGRKIAQAWRATTGSEPQQSGWAVAHHRLVPVFAYDREHASLLADVAGAYKHTAHLAGA